jgi:uncharacterized protein (UPF0371 family)
MTIERISHAPGIPQQGFDNDAYVVAQLDAFQAKMDAMSGAPLVVEFGGKPFGDHHASRVLPGYDPHIKAEIIRNLQQKKDSKIAMVLNARDVLYPPVGRTQNGRIRGDSGLRYEDETIRMIRESEDIHGFEVDDVVLSVTPLDLPDQGRRHLGSFASKLARATGKDLLYTYEVPDYPKVHSIEGNKLTEVFADNDTVSDPDRNLILISPGGGSGKFGVALSEIYKKLADSKPVGFAKFETFPIFKMSSDHPLNLAFIAATADLGNYLVEMKDGQTNYDKDCENFELLAAMAQRMDDPTGHISSMTSQFDFSVNVIEEGITDEGLVKTASQNEIMRRLERYKAEFLAGDEKLTTIERAAYIAGRCAVHMAFNSPN